MTRPLVVRFGALGDMVLLTVPIRILHERFGEPVDILSSGEWTGPLLSGQAGVGEIFLMGSRATPYWLAPNQWRLVRELRARGAGPTWLFDAQNAKARWLLQRAGWDEQQFIGLERLPDIRGEHFCDRWRRFAASEVPPLPRVAGTGSTGAAVPQLRVPAQARAGTDAWLGGLGVANQPLILVQVGNKRTMRRGTHQRRSNTKYWPADSWAAVLRALRLIHPSHALLLLGVAREARMNDEISRLAGIRDVYNVARQMSVPRLMALCERAFGMISVDTGPAHVAAAIGCPLLVLFDSPAKATMYAPRARRLAVRHLVAGADARPSLLELTPQQVMTAWRELLSQGEVMVASATEDSTIFNFAQRGNS